MHAAKMTLLLLGVFSAGYSQAPSSVHGLTYREHVTHFIRYAITMQLHEDGTYTLLYRRFANRTELFIGSAEFAPEEGTYSYEKTGENTARLTFVSAVDPPAAKERDLFFHSASAGSVGTGQFWFMSPSIERPLLNAAIRGFATKSKPVILGFIIDGRPRDCLLRGVGAGLRKFSVSDAAKDARLDLFRSNALLGWNDRWDESELMAAAQRHVAQFVGAFPLEAGSGDAAMLVRLDPGAYTVHVFSDDDVFSEVLAEVYVIP